MKRLFFPLLGAALLLGLLFWWQKHPEEADENGFSGYGEGELVYVAAPLGGELQELNQQRGDTVEPGSLLFTLEREEERAARNEASENLAESQTILEKSRLDFQRAKSLREKKVTAPEAFDAARQALLGSEHQVAARKSALVQADWRFEQKQQAASTDALVYDTYQRPGEWVSAGTPVLSLLPPAYMKVRFFVPETALGKIYPGLPVEIFMDGRKEPLPGRVSFVSPQAEYTLPIIYSRENRAKLVFLVEASLAQEYARLLHPGAPVEVRLTAPSKVQGSKPKDP